MSNNIPSANNNLNPLGLFVQKKKYNDLYPKSSTPVSLDIQTSKRLYGKVNRRSMAVMPNETFLKQAGEQNTFALNFVVDAFNAMKTFIKQGLLSGKINPSSHYVKMEVKNAWESPKKLYHEYMLIMYQVLTNGFLQQNNIKNEITNFDTFLKLFINFIQVLTEKYPFTLSAFILSNLCTNNVSGLIIEIANESFDDDKVKFGTYINDKNFDVISNIAQNFGFFVDKNAPWRFIANIGSSRMGKFMANTSFSLENVFNKAYLDVALVELEYFKTYTTQFYNSFIQNGINNAQRVTIETIPENVWLRLFLLTKISETSLKVSQQKFEQECSKILEFKKYRTLQETVSFISKKYSYNNVSLNKETLSLNDFLSIQKVKNNLKFY